jgi:2-dehydro-3-deoxyphosphogluconate aldolase/(4S)-4-hydroxy-2-oxoglutarate aldolase
MLPKLQALTTLHTAGAVLIIRVDDEQNAYDTALAAVDGGIRALEVTLSVPGALRVVERLASRLRDQGVLVGAGTVLDAQAAFACVQAGAQLLVSPQLNPDMLAVARRYQAVSISGAATPTEMFNSIEAGADLVKLFPATQYGPGYVREILAPLPGIGLVPTGGVTADNVGEWFDAGVAAVGIGSYVTRAGDYAAVLRAAEIFTEAVQKARTS